MSKSSKKNSYKKQSFWKHAVIVLFIGTVFYGGVYLLLVAGKGDYKELGSSSGNSISISNGK